MAASIDDFFAGVERRQHAWPAGREDVHWHLLFDEGLVQTQLVLPYRELTHRPGLEPVAAGRIHTTVMHGGPVDQYTDSEITTIVDRVGEACATIAPFDLVYDRPTVGTVAVECPARPGAPARRLWELTTRIDADVTGGRFARIPAGDYYPHASLAYGIGGPERADRRAMKAWLSDHPDGHGGPSYSVPPTCPWLPSSTIAGTSPGSQSPSSRWDLSPRSR